MKKIIIVLIVIISSCKSSKLYTAIEKENIRITDSIAKTHIQDLIIKHKEDYYFYDDRDYNQDDKNQRE